MDVHCYSLIHHIYVNFLKKRHVGKIDLQEGDFTLKQNERFIVASNKIFVNNANEIFAARCTNAGTRASLDNYVASLFARMAPNTVMITLEKIT